jgi:signal transduction histidine kinase
MDKKIKKSGRVKCRDVFDCNNEQCPAFRSKNYRCWISSGSHQREANHEQSPCKTASCLDCEVFKANLDAAARKEVIDVVNKLFRKFMKDIEKKDRELEGISMELALSLSEVFEALKRISSGDPTVRISESSDIELIRKLKHMVNLTAKEIGEIVDQSHGIAIGIAEHFDVLHRVSRGELNARVGGGSDIELMESLKKVTNEMIDSISREITERRDAQLALQESREELEHRVRERTAELSVINDLLKEEIDDRKLAEEEVRNLNRELKRKVSELVEANKELDAFNYTVSHDLKAPLIVIGGFARRLLKIHADGVSAGRGEMLAIILENTRKMERLIQDLLAFSRAGRQQMKEEEIDMKSLAAAVVDELKPLSDGRKIAVDLGPLPPSPGDVALIKQVFINLLSNAVKFTGAKKRSLIEVGCRVEGDENVYYVKDNGIGFNSDLADKLFSLFHRLPGSGEFEGTGVGLSIVQRIINRHGGRVWAEGKEGKGTIVYFSLPKKNC